MSSCATAPATAAIGVMKPARNGSHACHMRRATAPCSVQSSPRPRAAAARATRPPTRRAIRAEAPPRPARAPRRPRPHRRAPRPRCRSGRGANASGLPSERGCVRPGHETLSPAWAVGPEARDCRIHAQPSARERRPVVLPGATRQRLLQREHMLHVTRRAPRSRRSRMLNSIGATIAGVGTVPNCCPACARHRPSP